MLFLEYILVFKFFFCSILMGVFLFCLSFFLVFQDMNSEKLSVYECGFNPFSDTRMKFEVKFYLIGILFIVFDLELSFLLPWVVVCTSLPYWGIFSMVAFLLFLGIGFVYELVKGALN